ncbi:TPA: hypothetical protein N0F65_010019 [Lagenidium giganteum]|uniref:THH1/TOM1/TOM3 domain-containing protein n=1 Tax=Lagenidium giganteum TaxID=4803 RepID=A0AAV2ZAI2_9STRA|nr:TPA: hypothetical protein N0F65_010019 [Lagenidium giganteum]
MPLFLANLAMASYFLALCYMMATVVTCTKYIEVRRALRQHHHTGWSTVQLLILSIALGCLFRTTTFSTLCIFDSQNAAANPYNVDHPYDPTLSHVTQGDGWRDGSASSDQVQRDLDFYNKVVAVLFNLPDYLFVSSYILLVLVWAEAFQSSRRHWFSAAEFRRRWMIFYLVFNGALYMMQVVLYSCLFLYDQHGIFKDDKSGRLSLIPEMIFYVVAATDLLLPLIILATWLYLTLSLSGFPFKSPSAQARLRRVGKLAMAWSFGRISYSVITLLTFTQMPPLDEDVDEHKDALASITEWESRMHEVVDTAHSGFHHHKHALQLHLETDPLPFHPSAALVHLVQRERQQASKLAIPNKKPTKQQQSVHQRSAEYLERRLESEIRQHYELENAQAYGKWKKFHIQMNQLRLQLAENVQRDFQQLCHKLHIVVTSRDLEALRDHAETNVVAAAQVDESQSNQIEDNAEEEAMRAHMEREWIAQERFNIQEAFTNQTKKISLDFQTFMDQLNADYAAERTRILSLAGQPQRTQRSTMSPFSSSMAKQNRDKKDQQARRIKSHFKSSIKRSMLVQTAPVVDPATGSSSLVSSSNLPATIHDVDRFQQQLMELEQRFHVMKEVRDCCCNELVSNI